MDAHEASVKERKYYEAVRGLFLYNIHMIFLNASLLDVQLITA